MTITDNLRLQAVNRRRQFLFGDSSLDCYGVTPADGETVLAIFTENWCGQRLDGTTIGAEAGSWQFHIAAVIDWDTSQEPTMKKVVALRVGPRRWKVVKLEMPIGLSLMWKIRAEIQ